MMMMMMTPPKYLTLFFILMVGSVRPDTYLQASRTLLERDRSILFRA